MIGPHQFLQLSRAEGGVRKCEIPPVFIAQPWRAPRILRSTPVADALSQFRASFSGPMGDVITGRKEVDDMSSPLTLAGIYRDGKVEFAERPTGVGEDVPVLVTFLPANQGGESEPSA